MSIKVFKLINGEELIAEVLETYAYGSDAYDLKSPATIIVQQTEQGVGIGLAPYMPYVTGNVCLNKSAVASHGTPEVKMENEYRRIFGSGIQIAQAGSLAGL
jgi:hypothetical protein